MLELFVDSDSIVLDNYGDAFEIYPKYAERCVASAIKSEGHRLREMMQYIVQSGRHPYVHWPDPNPHTLHINRYNRRRLWKPKDAHKDPMKKMRWEGVKGSKKRVRRHVGQRTGTVYDPETMPHPFTALRGAFKYKYNKDSKTLQVGLFDVTRRTKRNLNKHLEGYTTTVTKNMRRMFFARGFPLKETTRQLVTPARPFIPPIIENEEENIVRNVEAKFWANLKRYMGEYIDVNLTKIYGE